MDELLRQPTRRRIYEVVARHPGASARDIQRIAGLAWGETAYHLDQLTRVGALRRERGGRRDYYFRHDMTWEDRRLLRALRCVAERRVLVALKERPGRTLAQLTVDCGLSQSTTAFHLRVLVAASLVESSRDGNARRYQLARPDRFVELLRTYRESFQDRIVDRFVEAWSSLLR